MQLKRLLSLILSGILLIGVVGCGTTSTESTVDDKIEKSDSVIETDTVDDEIEQSDSDIETDNDSMYSTNECDTSPIIISSSSDTPILFYNQYGVEVTLTNVEFTEREVDGEIFTNIEVQFLCTNNNIYKEDVAINFQNFSVDGNALKVNSSLLSFDDERDFNREIYYERKNSKETLYFPFYENFSDKDFNSITGTISLIDESGNTLVSRDIVIGNDGITGLHLFEKYGVHYIQ